MLTKKYRPKTFDEVVGQKEIIENIKTLINRYKDKEGELCPSLLFLGTPGCGKTTIAQIFAREMFGTNWHRQYAELNASDERGIGVVRGTIKRLSKVRGKRVILLDEFDNMTPDAQQALRRIMETTRSAIFILSGNREHKIISPILSRCVIFRFKKLSDAEVLKRVVEVCIKENISVTVENHAGLKELAREADGDLRSALNILERLVKKDQSITTANIVALKEINLAKTALKSALGGDFDSSRRHIEDAFIGSSYSTTKVLNALYEAIGQLEEKYKDVSIRLYEKLAEIDYSLKIGGNPIFQFVGFMAFAWVLPNLPNQCPALERR